VLRGGSWINDGRNCRSANRNGNDPGNRNDNIGFRLSRAPPSRGGEAQPRHLSPPRSPRWGKQEGRRRASRARPEPPPASRPLGRWTMNAPFRRFPSLFPEPWASGWGQDRYGLWQSFTLDGVTQILRWIPPGEFLMGSPETEAERESFGNDETQHPVCLTRGFWLADTACTQALWRAVLGEGPSGFEGGELPVENVSWEDVAERFLPALNDRIPGLAPALPTEAQWEYACRAGTTTPFWFGDNISPEQVNYDGNYPYGGGAKGEYRKRTVEVKALPANDWGLYEMHGNVWEWCADWLGEYPREAVVDPEGPETGRGRVLRGGSWFNAGGSCRSADRIGHDPGNRGGIGFRLSRGSSPPAGGERGRGRRGGRAWSARGRAGRARAIAGLGLSGISFSNKL
jgi:sulfatase modifying factor 1